MDLEITIRMLTLIVDPFWEKLFFSWYAAILRKLFHTFCYVFEILLVIFVNRK